MASGLALSTARGEHIYVGSEIRDSLSLLDILNANQFEGHSLDPEDVEHMEETFYRGAPPEWLNFHISEQAKSDGTGTSFIKRDGYDTLRQQIQNKRKLPGISTVKLFHQPGCGGTTLAMQVLWDLRKTFRCAVLTGSTSDITNVATDVVHLFTAGSRRNQNTVLLLLNDEHNLENLQDSIMEKMAEQKIVTTMPVVIFLTCVRKDAVLQSDHVFLRKVLSDTEKQKFNEKKEELSRRDEVSPWLLGFVKDMLTKREMKVEENPVKDIMDKCEDNVKENMSPSDEDTPESHIIALFKEWPEDNNSSPDLMLLIRKINHSYEGTYAKYLRSRYLCPLFYLGKDEALSRIVPTSVSEFLLENEDATTEFINYMMNKDKMCNDLSVQKNLLAFEGVVRNCKLFATLGGKEIMVNANKRDSLWIQRQVSFYLGFTIRGLIAFGIQTKNIEQGPLKSCASCGGVMDSSWTATTPDSTTEHGILTYMLQSEAGQFKCSVSGLRWVCKKKVIFTYQFKSWEEHRQKLNLVHCKPGGPLMNIRVIVGELDEVHFPHWICIDGFPQVSDMFAVLHKGQSGHFLEEVSEVTSSHVRLFQPSFPTNGVMIADGFPVKAHCNVLIYQANRRQLTLHIYVIIRDPDRLQEVEQMEKARKSQMIQKPNPEKSLTTLDSFILTTDADAAEISLGNGTPNFFKVVIENADSDFKLTLGDGENHTVWTCEISKDEYRN
ncbi:sterile alpha motif domain-containing protein 9-like [Scomber scombrus]|uniref:Sterile alpha motif domain-containing protein 9-like n=1 Tax=Scomber scombrus TaxID=13677 RepID=A0AAV1Q6S6_SCOSC